jgi:hypothetical protein
MVKKPLDLLSGRLFKRFGTHFYAAYPGKRSQALVYPSFEFLKGGTQRAARQTQSAPQGGCPGI